MLDLAYILATCFFEKQKPKSVSTDLVALDCRTTDFAANRSQQAFYEIRVHELNLLILTFILVYLSYTEKKKEISNNHSINIYIISIKSFFYCFIFKVVMNNILIKTNIRPLCSKDVQKKIILRFLGIFFFLRSRFDTFKRSLRIFSPLFSLQIMLKSTILVFLNWVF